MITYAVIMIRDSTRDIHTYLLGVYSERELAINKAREERRLRANKYFYKIYMTLLDNDDTVELVEAR